MFAKGSRHTPFGTKCNNYDQFNDSDRYLWHPKEFQRENITKMVHVTPNIITHIMRKWGNFLFISVKMKNHNRPTHNQKRSWNTFIRISTARGGIVELNEDILCFSADFFLISVIDSCFNLKLFFETRFFTFFIKEPLPNFNKEWFSFF